MSATMKVTLFALVVILFGSVHAHSQSPSEDVYKGAWLYHACQSAVRVSDAGDHGSSIENMQAMACLSYISAVRETYLMLKEEGAKIGVCLATEQGRQLTPNTLARVYVKYMAESPLMMDQVRLYGVLGSFKAAFPCK